jgi:NitT/TauT family transport system ATP-binding protein
MSSEYAKLAIELVAVTKRFKGASIPLYCDFSMTFQTGKSTVIVGPSGCGKSTLLNMISLALAPDSGEIIIDGRPRNISHLGELPIAYLFQKDALVPWATVLQNALLGVACRGPVTNDIKDRAVGFLELLGLGGYEFRYPHTLSGGQKQLVALVQNLLIDPDILILDEPFAHLDFQTKLLLEGELLGAVRLTRSLKIRPTTLVLVTHDLEEAVVIGDRIVVMGRRNNASAEIVREFFVPIPESERDPVQLRQSAVMRSLFHDAWNATKMFARAPEKTVGL